MGVDDEVFSRLAEEGVPNAQADMVVAALISDDELDRALAATGDASVTRSKSADIPDESSEPKRAYLSKISVTGFRGIGPTADLPLAPGPGLTLVMGRNGSGKSSFAEGAELTLTGDNKRWSGTGHSVEREGWRNLHQKEQARIDVALSIDGVRGMTTVTREWAASDDLSDGTSYVQAYGKPKGPVDSLGWSKAMKVYRPFLSYAELGALVSGKPAQMHDALEAILGLDQLKAADERLSRARRDLDVKSKQPKSLLPSLHAKLDGHPDERTAIAQSELAKKTPDLDALAALASGGHAPGDDRATALRQVTMIQLPTATEVDTVIEDLRVAAERVATVAGTPAAEARRLAKLLTAALDHQREHDGEPCPVCKGLPLDSAWAETARAEVNMLSENAAAAEQADVDLKRARRALDALVTPMPLVLTQDLGDDADPRAAAAAWERWATGRSAAEFSALELEIGELTKRANDALQRRAEIWQPVAVALAEWVATAKVSRDAADKLADVNKAIAYLKKVGAELRNERLAPFTEDSARVWEMLRQESNVELGPVTLKGSGPQRKVSLDVTVDGQQGTALSVMSQGELHALGLALFLPRAMAAMSPFGFMVIDDPVQSMDPAKVDGLAQVLHKVAGTRQVVVFTHDDRLAAAIRQLQIPATIWAVTRREQSVVTLTRSDDPVQQYIDAAFALALTKRLADDVKAVAVAGMCRFAIEAACVEVVRSRQIRAGVPHAQVEETLEKAQKLTEKLSLSFFDDKNRGSSEVRERLQRLGGQAGSGLGRAFVDTFNAVNDGTHEPYGGDLKQLARHTEKLARELRR